MQSSAPPEAAYLIGPRGSDLTYEGRALTSGKILSIKSNPPADILNSNQSPNNPTTLIFKVSPHLKMIVLSKQSGELVIEQRYCSEAGKIRPPVCLTIHGTCYICSRHSVIGNPFYRMFVQRSKNHQEDGKLIPGYTSPQLNILDGGEVCL